MNEVAQEAGVSPTTVSRYLNHRIELPKPTAARIDEAILRLRYRPNPLARRLSTGRTETIAIVAPEIANPFFADLAAAIEDEAERHGYAVMMSSTRGVAERELSAFRLLEDQHADGLILMTNRPDDGMLAARMAHHARVVLVDEDVPGVDVPRVFVENEAGGYVATRHLLDRGHRQIAYLGGPAGLMSAIEREAGFRRAMGEVEDGVPQVVSGAYSREFGARAVDALFDGAAPPTAIFAGSDFIAIGAMGRLRERGIAVPADISVVGFDDMPFADMLAPALTTVRQPVNAMGQAACRSLLALLNNQETAPVTRLPVALVERQSVANGSKSPFQRQGTST
ncbi:LacI family DNA-binding transcriptional regulator [Mesorhizobium liriopis]|uniref:LacI family DNA-binding transcriptional regulator n=1 Tax=Mesorhizobium liriopis TaxID=2953882 RepID=UPI002093E097|nr:LacI family DNA-binding transcriptional regulator [Mesorhizobium liriopis]